MTIPTSQSPSSSPSSNPISQPRPASPPPSHPSLRSISPRGFHFRPPPPPHALTTFLTPESSLFQTIHMGAAVVDPSLWTLTISGLVARPLTLSLADLLALPQTSITSFHECWGSPLAPPTNFVRRIGNVRWTGVRLAYLLDLAGPLLDDDDEGGDGQGKGEGFVWADGMESGEFGGVAAPGGYRKDLTMEKARGSEVIVAHAMNGEPLERFRGGPVRLVVPGWFGTNSVKWLAGLRVERGRARGPFTTRFYNERLPDGTTRPVWAVEVSSIIVGPKPGEVVDGPRVEVWGWAWCGDGVREVRIGVDGTKRWETAELAERVEFEWQRFSMRVELEPGIHSFMARATSKDGESQPLTGRRNHAHTVHVVVR